VLPVPVHAMYCFFFMQERLVYTQISRLGVMEVYIDLVQRRCLIAVVPAKVSQAASSYIVDTSGGPLNTAFWPGDCCYLLVFKQ
jgi:hypothetical protein